MNNKLKLPEGFWLNQKYILMGIMDKQLVKVCQDPKGRLSIYYHNIGLAESKILNILWEDAWINPFPYWLQTGETKQCQV